MIPNIIEFIHKYPHEKFVLAINTSATELKYIKDIDKIQEAFHNNVVPIDIFSEVSFSNLAYHLILSARENSKIVPTHILQDMISPNNKPTEKTPKKGGICITI